MQWRIVGLQQFLRPYPELACFARRKKQYIPINLAYNTAALYSSLNTWHPNTETNNEQLSQTAV